MSSTKASTLNIKDVSVIIIPTPHMTEIVTTIKTTSTPLETVIEGDVKFSVHTHNHGVYEFTVPNVKFDVKIRGLMDYDITLVNETVPDVIIDGFSVVNSKPGSEVNYKARLIGSRKYAILASPFTVVLRQAESVIPTYLIIKCYKKALSLCAKL